MTSGKKLSQKVESFSRFSLLTKLDFPSINGRVFSVKKSHEILKIVVFLVNRIIK